MEHIEKRIENLEASLNRKNYDPAWLAIEQSNGTWKISHANHGTLILKSENDLQEFIDRKGFNNSNSIRIIIARIPLHQEPLTEM